MNSTIIDIVFILFFVFMAIIGYVKGFITRLYDIVSLVIVIILSYWLAKPLSSAFLIYQYNQADLIASTIGQVVNQMIMFCILFVVLFIIKKIIGFVLKPTLKGLLHKFSITSTMDSILGLVLSIGEAVILSYIVVLLFITPIYPQGQTLINETNIAKHILNVVPSLTNKVQDLSIEYQNLTSIDFNSAKSIENLTRCMILIENLGVIDEEQFMNIFEENIKEQLQNKDITLSVEDKQQIQEFLENSQYNQDEIKNILKNINVSDQ